MTRCQSLNPTGLNGIGAGCGTGGGIPGAHVDGCNGGSCGSGRAIPLQKKDPKPLCSQFLMTFLLYFKMSKKFLV